MLEPKYVSEYVLNIINNELKRDSTPGIPYVAFQKTIGDVCVQLQEHLVHAVLHRLNLIVNTPLEQIQGWGPREYVHHGLCDPVRVFVKYEPLTKEKYARAPRLIMVFSLVDQIIERLLYRHQNQKEIEYWYALPSAPGIGFTDEMAAQFLEHIPEGEELTSSDQQGWDWTIPEWGFHSDARRRVKLCQVDPASPFAQTIMKWSYVATRSILVDSRGRMWEQMVWGLMKSGRYATSSTNSYIRSLASRLVGFKKNKAAGDDCVEWGRDKGNPVGVADAYAAIGFTVKQGTLKVTTKAQGVEFCSHRWIDGKAIPMNADKMLYNLVAKGADFQMYLSFKGEIQNLPLEQQEELLGLVDKFVPDHPISPV